MRKTILALFAAASLGAALPAGAQQYDIQVNTPAAAALRASLKARHQELLPYMNSGALGIARDGSLVIRDAGLVPLSARQTVNRLVAAENADWAGLYREIANANGHPEWVGEVKSTFAQRRVELAHPGWWVEASSGWVKK